MGLPSFIPPDGPISFTITGTANDGTLFNVVYGESFIDFNPPQIIIDPVEAVNSIDFTITGSVIDVGGLQIFNSTISSGSVVDFVAGYEFSSNYQVSTDGKYNIVFYAEDVVGNKATRSIQVIVDQVNPKITFISPEEDATVRPGQAITFSLADANSGLNNDYIRKNWSWYNLIPKYIHVTLDGIEITTKLTYSNFNYRDKVTINNNFGTFEIATLSSLTATFNPKLHGFLGEGNHQLIVNLKDRAGNEIEKVLSFNSINPPPYIEEKNLDMITGTGYQTLIYELEIQEYSDRGFDRFELLLDGELINDTLVFIPDPVLPYKGLLKYSITRNFEEGSHTLDLTVYDGIGQSTNFLNGFYHDPRILVPLNFTWSTDYVYDNQLYIGNHQHQAQINTNYHFKPGSSSIYGYSKIMPPSSVFYDPKLPMGFQRAYTRVQLNPADAKQSTHLSFWMTNILDKHICGWGWGDTISIFFSDGYQTLPAINLENAPGIVYHHHQAPHVTKTGFVDSYLSTAKGADGRTWKNYVVEIPEGLDKSSISVIIEWQAKNWNSWGTEMYNEISSMATHFEFFTPLVVDISPVNLANDVPLTAKIKARFRLPLDETGINDKFYLTDVTGIKIASSIQLNGDQIILSPDKKLNSNNKYRVLVSPDIKTIYGRILPKPDAYRWEFTTLPGETSAWQTIRYNGEEYQVYLIWADGYSGGNPNYISPGLMKTYYGASLLGVDVVKKVGDIYYNVPDMNTKKLIVQAAQRKAYYDLIDPYGFSRLINQGQIDYVYNGAHATSGLFLYIFDHVPGVDLSEIPDDEDVIIDVILLALGDGSNPYEMPAALTSGLNYFSIALSGCQKINQAVEKMREMKASKISQPFEASVIGDVLEIAELVQGEVDFQKSLWEYMYKAMWSIEVAKQYRSQLSAILPHTSGDTRAALSQLLSRDVDQVKRTVIQKCALHVADQSVEAIKQVLVEAASSNPYVKIAFKTTQIFFKIAGFTRWDDVRADSFIALAQEDAEDNFFNAWKHLTYNLQLIPDNQITPYDLSLISTSSKVRYSAAGNFYDTMVIIGDIVKYWDAVLSMDSGKINYWNNIISTWSTTAGNYQNSALNLIPEISSSNADTAQLLSLIRSSTYNKATYAQIGVYSPVTILLTAPDNRKIGYDHLNNVNINDFDPEGAYNGPYSEPQFITIPLNLGYYTMDLFGTGDGPYHITIETLDEWGEVISGSQWSGNAYPGMNTTIQFILDEYGSVVHHDDSVPVITVQGLIDGGNYSGFVNPSIRVFDDNLEYYTQILDGKLYSGGKITTPGQHVLIIRATDGVNVVYEIINFFIETSFIPEPGIDDGYYDRIIPAKVSYTPMVGSGKIVTIPNIVSDAIDETSSQPQEPASSTEYSNNYLLILILIIIAASGALILYKNK
ncbi:MAG: Ig-like domain-containing protein [Euryarchaeota archaeon]